MTRALLAIGADLAAGFGLLTRLPVAALHRPGTPFRPGRAVWCYPLAGALLGAIAAGCLLVGCALGLPPALAACWCAVVSVWLTGALHEDGLADLADGLGGGRTPQRRLEIMRDSRIGAFGALALALALLIRLAALSRLAALPPAALFGWLVAAGALSRAAMLPVLMLPPARQDGLGHGLGRVPAPALLAALLLSGGLAFGCLSWANALPSLAAAALVGTLLARQARARLGGRTGDVLGACVVAAECVLLTLACRRP